MNQLAPELQEKKRLEAVEKYASSDVLPGDILNVYVRLAAAICEAPIALVSIVGNDGLQFRARYGLDVERASRHASFCLHAIEHSDELLVVPDALSDRRFAQSSLVTGEPFVRFYAGVPLVAPGGFALGTLCVIGFEPRMLDERAQSALCVLRDAVMESLEEKQRRPWRHEHNPFLFERNPNPMWIYDSKTLRFLAVNDAATRLYGYSREEFLAMTIREVRPASDVALLENRVAQIGHGLAHSKGWKHRKHDGTLIDVTITSEEVRYRDRQARLVLATDITGETRAEAALAHLAHHDALTGLLNRAGLQKAFDDVLGSSRHSSNGGAVLFLDLERFKTINDNHGHAAGDALLVCVGRRLSATSREDDLVARTGGDEFVMIVPGLHSRSQAERFVADVLASIGMPYSIDSQTYSIGVTIGVSFFPSDGTTAAGLLAAADAAMYRAKRSADRVSFYDSDASRSH